MNIQRHNVEDMSPQEIRLNLYITQLIIIGIGCLLAYILFQDVKEVFNLWKWEPVSILIIGFVSDWYCVIRLCCNASVSGVLV